MVDAFEEVAKSDLAAGVHNDEEIVKVAIGPIAATTLICRPVHLASSCDEEVQCADVVSLIDYMANDFPQAAAVAAGQQ